MKYIYTLFKKSDLFLFNKVDELKKKPDYAKVQEFIGKIDDEFKEVAKIIATAAFLLLPFIFLFIFFLHNMGLHEDIAIRKEFINLANEIIASHKQIGSSSQRIISTSPIEGQGGFNSRISNILSSSGTDIEKIQVSNFLSEDIAGNIIRSEGDFRFTAMTTEELANLFIALVTREKMKVSTISVRKNMKTNLLNGTFRVVHFAKNEGASTNNEQE